MSTADMDRPIRAVDLYCSGHGLLDERSRGMWFLLARNRIGALRLALAKGEIFTGSFVKRDSVFIKGRFGWRRKPLASRSSS
jgi:hypothetical protein